MPSFGDGHAHPMLGGLEYVGPAVRPCTSVEEIVEAVRVFAEEHPDAEWIVGASYDSSLAPDGLFDARWLDEAVPDRPVMLRAWDYHTVWCNSVALQRAGITPDTPDPVLGEIPHREDGSVLGTLREWGAVDLVTAVIPERDEDTRVAALGTAADYYLARGVTWVQDAWVEPGDVDTYIAAAERDALRIRFNLALYADPRHFDSQLDHFAQARRRVDEVGSPLLTAHTVKFFADGVVENETGALLAPYCDGLHQHGMQVWEGDSLAEAARRVDELGLQIHIHAIGDAAVRQALDAIEYAAECNGPRDRRPVIAHVQLVDDADIHRFAKLGVIPNMQPLWAQLDALMTMLTIPRLGAETGRQAVPDEHARQHRGAIGVRIRLAGVLRRTAGRHRDRGIAAHRRGRSAGRLDARGDPADGGGIDGIYVWCGRAGVRRQRRCPVGDDRRRRQCRSGVARPRPAHHVRRRRFRSCGTRNLPAWQANSLHRRSSVTSVQQGSPSTPAPCCGIRGNGFR